MLPQSSSRNTGITGASVPDGEAGVGALVAEGQVIEFLKDQYRHCKPILVLGRAAAALEDRFVLEALPPLTLKGFGKPVAAFRFAGARGGA